MEKKADILLIFDYRWRIKQKKPSSWDNENGFSKGKIKMAETK